MDNITRSLDKQELEKKILELISEFEKKWVVCLSDIGYESIGRRITYIHTEFII